jgi:hypothetical protein
MRDQGKGSVQRDQSRVIVSKEEFAENYDRTFNKETHPTCCVCNTIIDVKFYPFNKLEESFGGEWFCIRCANGEHCF